MLLTRLSPVTPYTVDPGLRGVSAQPDSEGIDVSWSGSPQAPNIRCVRGCGSSCADPRAVGQGAHTNSPSPGEGRLGPDEFAFPRPFASLPTSKRRLDRGCDVIGGDASRRLVYELAVSHEKPPVAVERLGRQRALSLINLGQALSHIGVCTGFLAGRRHIEPEN